MLEIPKDIRWRIWKLSEVTGYSEKEIINRMEQIMLYDERALEINNIAFQYRYAFSKIYDKESRRKYYEGKEEK